MTTMTLEPVRHGASALAALVRRPHVQVYLAILAVVVTTGAMGYIAMGGWSVLEALYMTVITLTTVGFREVRPLDSALEIWTMGLAITGVGIIFGTVGIIAEELISEVTGGKREVRRMAEAVASLRDHYVLCGYGRVGSTVARELVHDHQQLVVIDVNQESLTRARADGHLVVEGDATEDATLRAAGIERALGLITTVDSDAHNVYVILSARAMNPGLYVVGRASSPGAEAKLTQAGANRVVSPYSMAGRRLAELALRPRVVDFIDLALSHGELAFSLEEVVVAAGGPLEGRTVGELRDEGIFALAIVHGERDYEPNPPAERRLIAGEGLIVSGSASTLSALRRRA